MKTRDGAQRLPELLAQVQSFADEIIVAVDEGSVDDSLEVARAGADLVLRFRHSGLFDPADTVALEHTRCDWTLRIDDDERVDSALPAVIDELLRDARYTHWNLPWLTVTSMHPPLAIYRPPWQPRWMTRVVRADPAIVWRPSGPHEPIRVMGLGGWESRTAILHLEPVLFDRAGIDGKIDRYTSLGRVEWSHYDSDAWRTLAEPLRCGPLEPRRRRPTRGRVDERIVDLDTIARVPGWGAAIDVSLPATALSAEELVVEARLRNTGSLTWWPTSAPDERWPQLGLHCSIRAADGAVQGASGYPLPRIVAPGEQTSLLCPLTVPAQAGTYTLEWDIASHNECWFSELGSAPLRTQLVVA